MRNKEGSKKKNIVGILLMAILIVTSICFFVNADDTLKYVVDVIDAKDQSSNIVDFGDISVQKQILKENNKEPYYNSNTLKYQLSIENINEKTIPEIALIVDSSFSTEVNDNDELLKEKAIELSNAILKNCQNAKISVFNGKERKLQASTDLSSISNAINNLILGEGADISKGIELASNSFSAGSNIEKYIIIFTDATDYTKDIINNAVLEKNARIFAVSVNNIMSDSYIENGKPVNGKVQMIYSDSITDEEKVYDEFNTEELTNIINTTLLNINIKDTFPEAFKELFDFELITTSENDNLTAMDGDFINGYEWNAGSLKYGETKKIEFRLTIKDNITKEAATQYTYVDLYSSDNIDVTYDTSYYPEKESYENGATNDTQNHTVKKDKTPIIRICDKYSVTLKAVNEENLDYAIEGVKFHVVAKDDFNNIVYDSELTTDAKGEVVADNLKTTGTVHFEITPTIEKLGYGDTDRVEIDITNYLGKNFTVDSSDWEDKAVVNNAKRNISITIPINTNKFQLELNLTELNNVNAVLPNTEFRLIQPKPNTKSEFIAKYGTTDSEGKIIFTPSIMTTKGTYEYVLSQQTVQDGYYSMGDATIKITFDENGEIVENGIKVRSNNSITAQRVDGTHGIINVTNESEKEDTFNMELTLSDSDNPDIKIEGAEYNIEVTRVSNGQNVTNTYYKNITNEKGKVIVDLPGKGNIVVRITQVESKTGYELDKDTKYIMLSRVDGQVESVKQAYNENTRTSVDAKPYSGENKLLVNLTNKLQSERNIINLKLTDADEEDIPISNVEFKLSNNMNQKVYTATTDVNGIARIQIDKEDAGYYNYTISNESGLSNYYEAIADSNISVHFNDKGVIDDVSDVWVDTQGLENPILSIDGVDIVEVDGFADYTHEIRLGAIVKASNTYSFQIKLTASDTKKAQEGAEYDIVITTDDVERAITGRKTNADGIIETKLPLSENIRLEVTQKASIKKYKMDASTKEIVLHYNFDSLKMTLENAADSDVKINANKVVYSHTNDPKTADDVFLDFHIVKETTDGMDAGQLPVRIVQVDGDATICTKDSLESSGNVTDPKGDYATYELDSTGAYVKIPDNSDKLDITTRTDDTGELVLRHLNVKDIPIPGEATADIKVVEIDATTGEEKTETIVLYHLTYRYNQYGEGIELTNVEITKGTKLVKEGSREFSGRETSEGYSSYVKTTLYANYEMSGNLALDLVKVDEEGNILSGAEYKVQVNRPDGTKLVINNKKVIDDTENIELPGFLATEGSEIVFTETNPPIGYAKSENTMVLNVKKIDETGEIYLEALDTTEIEIPNGQKSVIQSSGGRTQTQYTVILKDSELDTFKMKINAINAKTGEKVQGYSFKVNSGKYTEITDATDEEGVTNVVIGPGYTSAESPVTYTISADSATQYYKAIDDIDVQVQFNDNREVKITTTNKSTQTSSTYGELENGGKWYIPAIKGTVIGTSNEGKTQVLEENDVVIDLYLENLDPLEVEIETQDRVTKETIKNVEYSITPNLGIEESTTDKNTGNAIIEVSYPETNAERDYTIKNNSISYYEQIEDQSLHVEYDNEGNIINDRRKTYVNSNNLEIDYDSISGKYIKLITKVEPRLKLNIVTKDSITEEVISTGDEDTEISYIVTDRDDYSVSGLTGTTFESGYVKPGENNVEYTISQTRMELTNYEPAEDKKISISYNTDGSVKSVVPTSNVDNVKVESDFTLNIINVVIYNNPRQGIVIENKNYYTDESISGAQFELISEVELDRTNTIACGADGVGDVFGSRIGIANEEIVYTVKQASAPQEYGKVKDFKIIVKYDADRNIESISPLNDPNGDMIERVVIKPSTESDRGYNGNDRGIVKLVIKSKYSFRINITDVDRYDNDIKIANAKYSVTSTIATEGNTVTNAAGKGTAYVDRTEPSTKVTYTVKEEEPGIDYQRLETRTIDIEVEFDQDGFVIPGTAKILTGRGDKYSTVSDIEVIAKTEDKFTINLLITNIPKLRVNITNIDRKDNTVIQGTKFVITSEIGDAIDNIPTNGQGNTLIRVDGNTEEKEVTYTIHDDEPSTEYQRVLPDVKLTITYNPDGSIKEAKVDDNNQYASCNLQASIVSTFDKLTVNVTITSIPKLRMNITNIDRKDNNVLIEGTEYSVTSEAGNNIDNLMTGTNGVAYSRIDGVTASKNSIIYTIHEDKSSGDYQNLEEDIEVEVYFENEGEVKEVTIRGGNQYATAAKIQYPQDSFDQLTVNVTITNNPIFSITVRNKDRITGELLDETQYQMIYNSETNDLGVTGTLRPGETVFKQKETVKGERAVYTLHEVNPSGGHQPLEKNIEIWVEFNADGTIKDNSFGTNMGDFAKISRVATPTSTQDEFTLELDVISNKVVEVKLNNYWRVVDDETGAETLNPIMQNGKYQIKATDKVSGSLVEKSQEKATETSSVTATTTIEMSKGLSNKTLNYAIEQTDNFLGYEKLPGIVNLEITFDNEGKISNTGLISDFAKIANVSVNDFLVEVQLYHEPVKEFGIHLHTTSVYDSTKNIDGVVATAYLTEVPKSGGTQNYTEDKKYSLTELNKKLVTGSDRDGDGAPDEGAGNDYQSYGKYDVTDGTSRILRMTVEQLPKEYQMYANDMSTTQQFQICLDIEFDEDEGWVKSVKARTDGLDSRIGWLIQSKWIEVSPAGYGINITLKFYPALQVHLHSQDMHHPEMELGAGLTLSTSTYTGYTNRTDVIEEGYVGYSYGYGIKGSIYKINQNASYGQFVRAESGNNISRTFYLYENSEPGQYQRYAPRYISGYYNNRKIAEITVKYDESGIVKESPQVVLKNNIPKDYVEVTLDAENKLDVVVKYLPTTIIKMKVVDEISNANISGVRTTPFNKGYIRYEYYGNSYETTNGNGESSWRYWGVNEANTQTDYLLNNSYYGNGFEGYFEIGNIDLHVDYGSDGRIVSANVNSKNRYGTGANAIATWGFDGKGGNVITINVKLERKFKIKITEKDMYDNSITLGNTFNVEASYAGEQAAKIHSEDYGIVGKVHNSDNSPVTYTISETSLPSGYLPLNTIEMKVFFNNDGTIGNVETDSTTSKFLEVVRRAPVETGKRNEDTIDLEIYLKKIPTLSVDLDLTDQFYKTLKLQNASFTLENDKGDKHSGSILTNSNGSATTIIGEVYPNETIKYTLRQTNEVTNYLKNDEVMTFEVKYNESGYIENYYVTNGGQNNIFTITPTIYNGKRNILLNVMNTPKYVNIGINNIDEVSNEGINNVKFDVTKQKLDDDKNLVGSPTSAASFNTQRYGEINGIATGGIDTVELSNQGRWVRYTIKQVNIPDTYRKIQDIVFDILYNNDGSIADFDIISNMSDADVDIRVRDTGIARLNNIPVQVLVTIKNNNGYDLIIKDEDTDFAGLGIEGTKYTVSVDGQNVEMDATDSSGISRKNNLRGSGTIVLTVAEDTVGSGYRGDRDNNNVTTITLEKGEKEYSLSGTNTNSEKVTLVVDEDKGTVTVTFKNETKYEVGISKYDADTGKALEGVIFKIRRQEVNDSGNAIGNVENFVKVLDSEGNIERIAIAEDITEDDIVTEDQFMTDVNGSIKFDLGKTPQHKNFIYTFEEIAPIGGYKELENKLINIPVNFNIYGQMALGESDNFRAKPTKYADNKNGLAVLIENKQFGEFEVGLIRANIADGNPIEGAEFKIRLQEVEVDDDGNSVNVGAEQIINSKKPETDTSGSIRINLGETPTNRDYIVTYEEVSVPEGYDALTQKETRVNVHFDKWGDMTYSEADNDDAIATTYLANSNGLLLKIPKEVKTPEEAFPYKIKVITEDEQTNKRINGSKISVKVNRINGTIKNQILDEELETENDVRGEFLLEQGAATTTNGLTADGNIEISVDQKEMATGYEYSDKTSGTIKVNVTYTDSGKVYKKLALDVTDKDGFDVTVDNTNGLIIVKMKNSPLVQLSVNANYRYYETDESGVVSQVEKSLVGATFEITSEIRSSKTEVTTDLDVITNDTNEEGNVLVRVGRPYPGKTIIYTLKATVPDNYEKIEDDIKLLVKYDSSGNVKYTELLTSENTATIVKHETKKDQKPEEIEAEKERVKRLVELKVYTDMKPKDLSYKVILEQHNNRDGEYDDVLSGFTYDIKVEEQYGQTREWIATTNDEGKIISPEFNGYGNINVTYTQIDAAEGYQVVNTTKRLTFVRNKTTKLNKLIYNDDAFDIDDPTKAIVKPQGYLEVTRFDLTINKVDQKDNTRITNNPAEFTISMLEKEIVLSEEEVNEEDGTISQDQTEIISEVLMGTETTKNLGKLTFRNLEMPEDEGIYIYKIMETQAPQGYIADEEGFLLEVTYEKNREGNLKITNINNISSDKTKKKLQILETDEEQMIAVNIKNTNENDVIKDDEYSLDITNVNKDTNEAIPESTIFKVLLPDEENTEVYIETAKSYLGVGKLEYCYIEQDKDYKVRLTHIKRPTEPTTHVYKFKQIKEPEGYSKIEEDLELIINFEKNEETGEIYISSISTSNGEYMRINASEPYSMDTSIGIDILESENENIFIKSKEYAITFADETIFANEGETKYSQDAKLEENEYETGDNYIVGIIPKLTIEGEENEFTKGTKLEDFIANIETNAESIKLYDVDNNEITDGDICLGTGMFVEFSKGSKEPIRLTIIAKGDINSDGILNLADINKIKYFIRRDDNSIVDTIEKFISLDVNLDGTINQRDMNNMKRAQNRDDIRELLK